MQILQRRFLSPFSGKKLRESVSRSFVVSLLCLAIGISTAPTAGWAQSGIPQTNLVPIGPTSGNFARPGNAPNPFPSTSAPVNSAPFNSAPSTTPPSFQTPAFPAPNFTPQTQAPSTFTPPAFSSPAPTAGGLGGFDPYASVQPGGSFGGGVNVTPIGPPTPISPGVASTPGFGTSGFGASNAPLGGLFGGLFSRPASGPLNAPIINSPPIGGTTFGGFDNANVFGQQSPGFGSTSFGQGGVTVPNGAFPSSSPSTLFPSGFSQGGNIFNGINPVNQLRSNRFFQGARVRHAYVGSSNDDDSLKTNDTDASVIFAFPNFLFSTQPLYVVPSFSIHLWDGPDSSTNNISADLPGSAYSGFLDVGWNSDPNQIFSAELGVRVGAFTDFNTFNSDTIRVLGKALGNFRLTPNSTLKGGVFYLDRVDVKLLPAGGILYQPNPYTRLDIFFPQPKFARYFRTIGTRDVWWFIAGDYGGGSWTIGREGGGEDQVDINELRAVAGFEWGQSDAIRAGRRIGFFDVGFAFERELKYRNNPADDLDLDDGIVFRLGIGY